MTPDQIQIAANALFEAEKSRQQMGLISLANPQMTMDDAYAIQSAYVDKKRKNGGKQHGWKIGLTSKAMQSALGIDIPDSGILFDDMLFETGATVPKGRFIQRRIEAEIAFVMKSPLAGRDCTRDDILKATDYVAQSLEILDTVKDKWSNGDRVRAAAKRAAGAIRSRFEHSRHGADRGRRPR